MPKVRAAERPKNATIGRSSQIGRRHRLVFGVASRHREDDYSGTLPSRSGVAVEMLTLYSYLLALVAVASCLWRTGAVPLQQPSLRYSTEENQLSIHQQRRSSQEKLHRAVSRFAATGRGIAGVTEYVMKAVDRKNHPKDELMGLLDCSSIDRIPSIPSLDPQECMKRSVCEAHNQPDRYGLVGLTLQLIFPPYLAGEEEDAPTISKYQQAARYGRRNDAECGRHFDGCIISPLEVTQKIINYLLR
ncbi:hypothetical protein BIW11_13060 [Tropilaelaps mercedesae]|uniref:Uncharacterized protein n=1 Tax=Tropilaelaps mercedesae TaxID=418985 RepID=A0A1V9X3X4_9ACAR|nr:hypothetical protein BIW11_13060 [Tropilaelaps mercedesae]